ncbi:MAG: ATP synthase subunit I [Novosphingobium sp.]
MMPVLLLSAWLFAGLAAGAAYFASIWWSARRFADGGRLTMTIALSLLRLAALGGLLALASLQGAGPLLAMALGVVLARFGVMRRMRESAS